MSTASATMPGNQNVSTARSGGRKRNYLRTNSLVMQKARSLSPQKTAAFIAEITGRPIRTVEYWLSTERLPGEAIGALIQSEEGFAFVEAIADASRPKWWRHVRKALALYDQQNNKFREAQNVATELVAALGQIAAGTSLRAAELDRDEADEIGNASAGARVQNRTVAKNRDGRSR